jgi:hypothetical protein
MLSQLTHDESKRSASQALPIKAASEQTIKFRQRVRIDH